MPQTEQKVRCEGCSGTGREMCSECVGLGNLSDGRTCDECYGVCTVSCTKCKGEGHLLTKQ